MRRLPGQESEQADSLHAIFAYHSHTVRIDFAHQNLQREVVVVVFILFPEEFICFHWVPAPAPGSGSGASAGAQIWTLIQRWRRRWNMPARETKILVV